MADLLASVAGLRALLKEDAAGLSDEDATLLLEMATGAVQGAARQDLVEVTETVTLMGDSESWFNLPQRPVTAVTSVKIDDAAVTDYKRFGARLWRRIGWATIAGEPSAVEVAYTHGFADWDRHLAPANAAALALAAKAAVNPIGVIGMSIDDYRLQFGQSASSDLALLVPENVRKSLRRLYGPGARLTRIGA